MKKLTKNKGMFIIMLLMFISISISTGAIIYSITLLSGIENTLRLIGRFALALIWGILVLVIIKSLFKNKPLRYIVTILVCLIYTAVTGFISYNIGVAYGAIDKVSSNASTYSSSIVTLKSNKAKDISSLGTSKVGILNDKDNVAGYEIPNEIIKDEKLKIKKVKYDSYVAMLNDLYAGKIDYLFLPTNYTVLFKNMDGFNDIDSKTKIIYTKSKKVANKNNSSGKKITKPFTLLIMGVDSEAENIQGASFNGDSLILITFNPTTLNSTILSIPRDTYVPIACFPNKRENKITHAAWNGEKCMMDTIENYTGVNIDYYVKINFKGVVKLVDALGGIDVDVPIKFCEQDSNRNFDNLQCLNKGKQKLNGEQALALSRHRKTVNDFVRGQNQQLVVKALMNKAKSINSLDTIYKLLDTISNNMETNMSKSEILSLYDIAKDISSKTKDMPMEELLSMQRLYLSGYDQYIYDYSSIDGKGTRMSLYNFVAYKGSLKDVVNAMKINLDLKEEKAITSFEFDVDTPYEEKVIGKDNYNETPLAIVPNFVGYNKSYAQSWCSKHGISLNVNTVSSASSSGLILSQSAHQGMDAKYLRGITITVASGISNTKSNSTSKTTTTKTKTTNTTTTPTQKTPNKTDGTDLGTKSKTDGGENGAQVETESPIALKDNGNNNI